MLGDLSDLHRAIGLGSGSVGATSDVEDVANGGDEAADVRGLGRAERSCSSLLNASTLVRQRSNRRLTRQQARKLEVGQTRSNSFPLTSF